LAFLTALHVIYGQETFVYVGSVLPFLIVVFAYGALAISRYTRGGVSLLLIGLLLTGVYHNFARWKTAVAEISALSAPPSSKVMSRNTCSFVKNY